MSEAHRGIGELFKPGCQRATNVILLALDAKRIAGSIGNFRHVEIDEFAGMTITPMIDRSLEPALEQHRGDADLVEHLQRRRMEGRGTHVLRAVVPGFEHNHVDPCFRKQRRHHRAHWSGPCDHNLATLGVCHGHSTPARFCYTCPMVAAQRSVWSKPDSIRLAKSGRCWHDPLGNPRNGYVSRLVE